MTSVGHEQRARRRKIGSAAEVFRRAPALERVLVPTVAPTTIQVPGAEQRFVPDRTAKPNCKVRWVDRRHGVVEATTGRSTSSEEPRAARAEATIRSSESDSDGADRRIGSGVPAEMTGSARFDTNGEGSTEPTKNVTDRCRRALMAIQAPGWADGNTLVVRTRPRQAESRVGDRSTDRTRPEWSVTERPREADRFAGRLLGVSSAFCPRFCSAQALPARAHSLARQQYHAATER